MSRGSAAETARKPQAPCAGQEDACQVRCALRGKGLAGCPLLAASNELLFIDDLTAAFGVSMAGLEDRTPAEGQTT